MAQVIQRRDMGPSGLAIVKVLKKGVRVEFADGDVYDIENGWDAKYPSGKYIVSLNKDHDRILGVRPPKGQYIFQFKQIGNRTVGRTQGSKEPGLPTNKIQRGRVVQRRDGKGSFMIPDQLVFTVECVVMQGPYEGLSATTNIPYSFTAPAQGEFTAYSDSNRNLENLEKFFLCVTGQPLTNIDIPFDAEPTTLLLRYEKYIQSHSTPFLGTINEKGFMDVREFSVLPADLIPVKKPAKKTKKAA